MHNVSWDAVCRSLLVAAVATACLTQAAVADDRLEYERRVGERYETLFESLDRNGDGLVTRVEAHGNLNFIPSFDDIDTNRNSAVTRQELRSYLQHRYGPHAVGASLHAITGTANEARALPPQPDQRSAFSSESGG